MLFVVVVARIHPLFLRRRVLLLSFVVRCRCCTNPPLVFLPIVGRTHCLRNRNVQKFGKRVIGRAGAVHPWCMIPMSSSEKKQSSTLNHKPQLSPQHRHHHDEVWKNGISYAVGLIRSIAYRRIRLVNKKTAIVANMTFHVGIN